MTAHYTDADYARLWRGLTTSEDPQMDAALEHRDHVMHLCGDSVSRYREQIAPWRAVMAAWARKLKVEPLAAVPPVLERMRQRGTPVDDSISWITTAALEAQLLMELQ